MSPDVGDNVDVVPMQEAQSSMFDLGAPFCPSQNSGNQSFRFAALDIATATEPFEGRALSLG